MSPNPLVKSRLASQTRLGVQLRAMRTLYSPLLAGRLELGLSRLFTEDGLIVQSASQLQQEISRCGQQSAAPTAAEHSFAALKGNERADERLQQFHRHGLATLARLAEAGHDHSTAPHAVSNRFVAWSWQHASDWGRKVPSISPATCEGMLAAHELLACQLATECATLGGKNALARAASEKRSRLIAKLEKTLKNVGRQRPETAEMLSHWLAIEALVFVLVAARTPAKSLLPQPLPGFWECLAADLAPLAARLLSANLLVLDAYPEVRQHIHRLVPAVAFKSLAIIPHVQRSLTKLQRFGGQLVVENQPQTVRRPLIIGDAALAEVEKFAALDSPALTSDESQKLRDNLHRELREIEFKLFRATVIPRPAFYDAFFDWAARHVVLTAGVNFPLSSAALDIVFYCHNLLALDQALAELSKAQAGNRAALEFEVERIRESLVPAAEVLERLDPTVGDMLVIQRSVAGLQASLAQRHAGDAHVPWDKLLPRLQQEIAARVMSLAAKSPLLHLTAPALQKLLGEGGPPAGLLRFLDDPQAEPIRDFAAGELAALVVANPHLMPTFGRRGLWQCLESETLGGALLVAEFMQLLFQKLFVPCDVAAAAIRDPHEAATAKQRQAAGRAFAQWFFNLDEPRTKALFETLVGLMKRVQEHAASGEDAADPRAALLAQRWRAVMQIATRGLVRRPWQSDAQRLLRMFWLNYCLTAYAQFDVLTAGLNTGNRIVDDLTSFGCWLTGELQRTERAFAQRRRRLERQKQSHETGETFHEMRESYVNDELKIMKSRLKNVVENPKFRSALLVRRLLIRSGKTWEWNQERIDQFVALMYLQRR